MKKNKLFTNKSMLCAILASSILAINVQPTFAMNESIPSNSTNTVASSIGSTCLNLGWQAVWAGLKALSYGSRHAIKGWKKLDKASPLITEVITSIFVTATLITAFKYIKKTGVKLIPKTGPLSIIRELVQSKEEKKEAELDEKRNIIRGDYKELESFEKAFKSKDTIDPKVKEIIENITISKESKKIISNAKSQKNNLEFARESIQLDNATEGEINAKKELKKEVDTKIEELEHQIRTLEIKKNDVKMPRTILLYGEPGSGKTKSANCFVELLKAKYIELPGTALRRGLEGDSSEAINELFSSAAKNSTKDHPCVIIINEIDGATSDPKNGVTNGLSGTIARDIQAAYDTHIKKNKANIYIIATSNYVSESAIPKAVSDRFQVKIEVKLQDENGRKMLLDEFTKEEGIKLYPELLDKLSKETKDQSNRQLKDRAIEINNNLIKDTCYDLKTNTKKVEELLEKANTNQSKLNYFTACCKYYPKKLASNLASIFIKKDKMIDLRKKDVNLEQPVIGNNQNPLQQPIVANQIAVVNNQQNQEVINIRENNNQESYAPQNFDFNCC